MSEVMKLKPCPFCGRADEEIKITQEFSSQPLYVECPCGCFLLTQSYTVKGAIDVQKEGEAS